MNSNISVDKINNKVKITPKTMLVGEDSFVSNEIFIKPMHDETKVKVKWKLLAKDFTDSGELSVRIKPIIETEYRNELTEDPLEVGTKTGDIEDHLVPEWASE